MKGARKRRGSAANTSVSPMVVLIGSYREDLPGLLAFSQRLIQQGIKVMHPPPLARVLGEESGFVRLDCDRTQDQGQVQRDVFALIDRADAVILYTPSGRIGISAALEIGYSLRAHKPIFSTAMPDDNTIRALISYEPEALAKFLRTAAAHGRENEQAASA